MTVADVAAVYAQGIEQVDLEHAIGVCFGFSVMNRMVDAFGADITEAQARRVAFALDHAGRIRSRGRRDRKDPPQGPDHPTFVRTLRESIDQVEGDAPPAIRRGIEARVAAEAGAPRSDTPALPSPIADFVDKIGNDVWSLTDGDFVGLQEAGWSEEAIYEFVYVAAIAAGLGRLEVGWQLIEDAKHPAVGSRSTQKT